MKAADIHSLALRSDLEIARFENVVRERSGYLVVETPANPAFYWGNFLVFPLPPTAEDVILWPELFRTEFAHAPAVRHQAFTWDSVSGELGAAASFPGFHVDTSPAFTLGRSELVRPRHYNASIQVRALESEDDWAAALENQLDPPPGFDPKNYRAFKLAQMARYRRMSEAGLGAWYGAFLGTRLVADCGLYLFGQVGRFQNVMTHPDYRRQGISATLTYECARLGLEQAERLVIVADPTHGADRVYRSIGFTQQEIQASLSRRALGDQAAGAL